MMVLGDKEDRRNDRGGWREWAVGPDGIKFSSAGVSRWLRNDLVRVLVRPATGVCSEEVAASFGDVQSSALRELMHSLLGPLQGCCYCREPRTITSSIHYMS